MATNKNEHLKKVLETHDIYKVENLDRYIEKKNNVKDALSNKFSKEKASSPIDSGSYAKKTAINTKFDIDCCIPFKYKTKEGENGFSTLKEMYHAVYDYLKNEYSNEDADLESENVRQQKVSVGLKFIFDDDDEFDLDVVMGRERPNHGDYGDSSTDLSLYISPSQRSKKEVDDNKTHIKTNVKKHVTLLSDKPHERKIARLLKVWKTEKKNKGEGGLIKSFIMELYSQEAFDNAESIPNGLWEKTKMVMEYIIANIETKQLIDPVNSSNIVSDSMSDNGKKVTKTSMQKTIDEIEADSDKIKEHFPINEDYNEGDGSNNSVTSVSTLGINKFG